MHVLTGKEVPTSNKARLTLEEADGPSSGAPRTRPAMKTPLADQKRFQRTRNAPIRRGFISGTKTQEDGPNVLSGDVYCTACKHAVKSRQRHPAADTEARGGNKRGVPLGHSAFMAQESRPGLQEEMEGVGELVGQKDLDEAKASGHSCLTKSRELGFRVQGADRGHMKSTCSLRQPEHGSISF
ncbi:hypothetical protein EYF80_019513 [Liparis tanakae]|uniref:Uncharacterized protein n=1 Tax=Liparis tanakae TaxID=230148 RepID=A0A4Z2HWU9_9TELE|nr:hypothetical protein EYF80_019513 [Liparis tanakae]